MRTVCFRLVEIDVAGAHYRGRLGVVDEGEQQMFKGCVFVVPLIGERQRLVKRLFQALGESRHVTSLLLHHALQRMLILSGEIHDLRHFGLGHLECIDPALANSMIVNM